MRAMRRYVRGVALAALTLAVSHCHRLSSAEPALASPAVVAPLAANATETALPVAPPLTLTASDGTGLALERVTARAVLEGPLAFTELRLGFVNPDSRTLEGTFKIALPQGASISRFAMLIDDRWQEGEVVARQRARVAYEDFLHQKRDPALLEQSAGNEFNARVFPIPAHATKELLVSYAEELRGSAPYELRLRGLPKLGAVDISVTAAQRNSTLATLRETDWAPVGDLVVDRSSLANKEGLRSGDLVLAPVHPIARSGPDPMGATVVLFDTSASRAVEFEAQVRAFRDLAAKLADATGEAAWTLACFDQSVEEVYSGPLHGLSAAVMDRIRARGPLGASDLFRALTWARRRAQETGAKRLLLVSDGVATAGESDRGRLAAAARELGTAGVERVDAMAVGGIRDDALLRALSASGLKRDGIVVAADRGATEIARRLGEATASGIAVKVEGARWWHPRRIDGAQSGDEVLVYAEVPDPSKITISVGSAPDVVVDLRPVERPLLERAWAQAKIASVLDSVDAKTETSAVRGLVVGLSTKYRVLSPYTALLVLETEGDYARLGIDRNALADVLTVQGSRVALVHRKDVAFAPTSGVRTDREAAQFGMLGLLSGAAKGDPNAPSAPWGADQPSQQGDAVADAFGAGGLGLSGAGEGGGGRGEGIGLGHFGLVGHGAGTAAEPLVGNGRGRMSLPRHTEGAPAPASPESAATPYRGGFADVMGALEMHNTTLALQTARGMHAHDPGDVMALVALGEALEARGEVALAARAYGSIIDLFPSRADMRRMAGERLERLSDRDALDLAVDTFAKSVEQRPDHPSSHRLLAFALLKQHDYRRALEAAIAAIAHPYPAGRFPAVDRVLREDVGLIGAAWAAAEPTQRESIEGHVAAAGAVLETEPSLRFVLNWETDANDVDLHVRDGAGDHAFYSHPSLASGGELYADVTTGYGPECFTVRVPKTKRSPKYALEVHYYARGPMGYGMGKVEIIDHDGRGGLNFSERPFVVMNDQAFVELGSY